MCIVCISTENVDHGKTTLLDSIRGTAIATGEAGGITQHVGASHIPIEIVKKICGDLLKQFKITMKIPGLLFVDTPGHESFVTLRKRGGSVADLAILVVDINEGFQIQTTESLNLLKQFKVPFIVAATKIDRIPGWFPNKNSSFSDSIAKQRDDVRDELENKLYRLVSQLADRGFESERFDRITNFTKQIAIVPCSGHTQENIAEVLLMLTGLAQQFLKNKLALSEIAKGSILEVKDVRGLGTTTDVILYDGVIHTGDYLIIGGRSPLVVKIKALLEPRPLQELRVERQFEYVEKATASTGVKVSAVGLDEVIAGSPIVAVKSEDMVEAAKKLVQKEIEEIIYEKNPEGITVKVDTIGSLEAIIKMLHDKQIPIRNAEVGTVSRQDIIEAKNVSEHVSRVVLVFNQKISEELISHANDLGVKIFENNIIYSLLEDYASWKAKETEKMLMQELEDVTRPCQVKFLRGTVFRQHSPAVFGVEVLKGVLKSGVSLKKSGKVIGKVKELQKEGKSISEANAGDKVAISMEEPTIGRHISEGDILDSYISESDLKILKKFHKHLNRGEQELLESFSK